MKNAQNFAQDRALSCVWIETGNARQPLACRWIEDEVSSLKPAQNRLEDNKSENERRRLCA